MILLNVQIRNSNPEGLRRHLAFEGTATTEDTARRARRCGAPTTSTPTLAAKDVYGASAARAQRSSTLLYHMFRVLAQLSSERHS